MSPRSPRHLVRARRLRLLCAAVAACAVAAIPAVAGAASDDPILHLSPVDQPTAPLDDAAQPTGGASLTTDGAENAGESSASTGTFAPQTDDLTGTVKQLTTARDRLVEERTSRTNDLLRLEAARERAEQELSDASDAIAARLVELLESDAHARLQAFVAARDALDPAGRAELVASLAPEDRALLETQAAATDRATRAGAAADALRSQVIALGTRIDAFNTVIGSRLASNHERGRGHGGSYSIDSDYVFATGPIPGIGYWGAVAGDNSMLSGWTGFAGAALGGVGCEAPDPTLKATGAIEQGDASWYGPGFDGQNTANGETYDQEALTAAHKTLPFGTIVRVYSSQTGRCVFVRINDRGPYVDGRIIDLSHGAATAIGLSGVASVQVEVWSRPGAAAAST